MYVRNGFTIEIYGFTHTLRTSLACDGDQGRGLGK